MGCAVWEGGHLFIMFHRQYFDELRLGRCSMSRFTPETREHDVHVLSLASFTYRFVSHVAMALRP